MFIFQARDEEPKLDDIISAIVDNINKRCDCSFTRDSVVGSVFQCFGPKSDSVTFRGGLRGLGDASSSALADHVAAWVATGQALLLQNVHYLLDSSCGNDVVIEDLLSPECGATVTEGESKSSLSAGGAVGVTIAVLVVLLAVVVTGLVIFMYWRRRHAFKTVEVQLRYGHQKCMRLSKFTLVGLIIWLSDRTVT